MAVFALFCLAGTILPEEMASPLYLSAPFRVLAAVLVAGLAVSLGLRVREIRSVRAAGSWLLHFSMVLIGVGAVYNRISSREVSLELIEGQMLELPEGKFSLELVKLAPFTREGSRERGHAATVNIQSPGKPAWTGTVSVNRPLKVGGMRVHLWLHGFAPLLEVVPGVAGEGGPTFVALRTELTPQVRYWRELGPPEFPEQFTAIFRPSPDGPFLRDPSMKMTFRGGRTTEVLRPGRPVARGGHEYRMGEVRYWAQFRVAKDPGLGLVFTGFWMAVAGASAALLPRLINADC